MPSDMIGDQTVRYSVKELLERIESKINLIDSKLSLKADNAVVEHLALRVSEIERHGSVRTQEVDGITKKNADRIEKLERMAASIQAVDSYRRWILGGGALMVTNMIINLAIDVWQLHRG